MNKHEVFLVSYDLKHSTRFKAILVPAMRETEDKNIDYVLHKLANTFRAKDVGFNQIISTAVSYELLLTDDFIKMIKEKY
ncbi:hypothetical protein [Aliarcobacter butzleri]|uniref:hypothetical protein n=1 Tax=Aliarcobacter butzleri TaxID=28197 RepID=UPI0021B255AF|nr:hypothetical protein [Aliarcobacter butzleri]MCT7536422.1 hypothetical protein [Aliarcobacter butzleri]MCT7623382.1 hypothetical protein [Aliarcobacter butzleri]